MKYTGLHKVKIVCHKAIPLLIYQHKAVKMDTIIPEQELQEKEKILTELL